jgi:hypothetical protein
MNHLLFIFLGHLFLLQALSCGICIFLRIRRYKECYVTFYTCDWSSTVLAETANDDSRFYNWLINQTSADDYNTILPTTFITN